MGRIKIRRKGITGLETAIILIAFVIVAAVFAFSVLNMGLLATQKAGSAVESGMKQAASAFQLSGSVIAYDKAYNGTVFIDKNADKADAVRIYVRLAPGKEPVDVNNLIVSYTNRRIHVSDLISVNGTKATDGVYAIFFDWIKADGDALLEANEVLVITINVGSDDIGADGALGANEWFKVEVKPPVGAVLAVERTLPAAIDEVMDLG